ncbi:hypothetical protein G5V59_06835 [Nocardioides sp. W3-2-3]|uniref:hypothetical protein n=1 Tax=Nocardioides convexus TaxID=2712224 RepID=UPI002418845E|nr:hypothetical protein [Nocardioides convexus]NHA00023.1 hypothetical protein [Nocardioides convexus]
MLNGRTRTTASLAALALTGTIAFSVSAPSGPANAEPDIQTVRARVDKAAAPGRAGLGALQRRPPRA